MDSRNKLSSVSAKKEMQNLANYHPAWGRPGPREEKGGKKS